MIQEQDIKFIEGQRWEIEIDVPDVFNMNILNAKIQVRKDPGTDLFLEFGTEPDAENPLTVDGQTITWIIKTELTKGNSGEYKWQLDLYADEEHHDKIPEEPYLFIVIPAIVE